MICLIKILHKPAFQTGMKKNLEVSPAWFYLLPLVKGIKWPNRDSVDSPG
jgi:hypothetical protein